LIFYLRLLAHHHTVKCSNMSGREQLEKVDHRKQMTQNWEQWRIHQKAVLPFSETWTGWRAGQKGT